VQGIKNLLQDAGVLHF